MNEKGKRDGRGDWLCLREIVRINLLNISANLLNLVLIIYLIKKPAMVLNSCVCCGGEREREWEC